MGDDPPKEDFNQLYMLDLSQGTTQGQKVQPYWRYLHDSGLDRYSAVSESWRAVDFQGFDDEQKVKFPYICEEDATNGAKLRLETSGFDADATWSWGSVPEGKPVVGFLNRLFSSDRGSDVGNQICKSLAKVPPFLPPLDKDGNPRTSCKVMCAASANDEDICSSVNFVVGRSFSNLCVSGASLWLFPIVFAFSSVNSIV